MDNSTSSIKMLGILNASYNRAIHGIPHVSKSVEELAEEYLNGARRGSNEARRAAQRMIRNQITKCSLDGAVTSLGGFATMAATLPANITSVMYMQLRMIACTAYMAGYDVRSDEVQTLCFACYAELALSGTFKKFASKVGEKTLINLIKKIPGSLIRKINRVVGTRVITKFGTKGAINLGKCIPAVGALIGGSVDFISTKHVAHRAMKNFFDGDFSDGDPINIDLPDCDNPNDSQSDDDDIIDAEFQDL